MTIDVVTAGGCTVDVVYAADGATRGPQLGGNAIYAAAGARVWGLRAGVMAFGGTGLPDGWVEVLAALDIDTSGLILVDVPASVTEFFYDAEGERTQRVWAPAHDGQAVPYLPADTGEPIRRLRLSAQHVPDGYLRAHGAHLAPMPGEAQRALATVFAPLGVLTLDPYPHVMAETSDDELAILLAPVAVFMPSQEEVRARFPDRTLGEALDRLSSLARLATVIKEGRQGALIHDRALGRRHVVPSVPVIAKDPTGAGDAFCGGVLAGLIAGREVLQAVACGAVSASFAVEDFGLGGLRRASAPERDRRLRWVLERAQ